jgi:shikimate kinase
MVQAKGISVFLEAEIDVLMRRVKKRGDRPLLKTADPLATLTALVEARYPIYREADITIRSRDVPHEVIVEDIVAALEAHLPMTEPT